ncbi:MAG: FAD-dependent oxidoreductase [Gallionella sp.]
MKPIVVLGSGLAGYTLVRELRKLDRDAAITLITRDSGDYYSKPMLSNALAQGKSAQTLVITAAADMAGQLGFRLLQHTEVLGIDRAQKQLRTNSGTIEYDRLVLALGADPIRLHLQGDAADAVMSVNDLDDYAKFRGALDTVRLKPGHIAIMGGGLIGCEFANDLATAGYTVTIIDPTAYPLSGLLPEHAGRELIDPLAAQGVAFRFGAAVNAVNLGRTGYALTLNDGTILQADLVLSAVGLRPRIGLAREAGLAVNRGIAVDARLCSSDASIYAFGDCAEIGGLVQPYVLPIMHAARVLAQVLAGKDARVEFPAMPVVVKTPAHPVAVLPVARDTAGVWRSLDAGRKGVKLGFFDLQDCLQGFALTGEYAAERSAMAKKLGEPVT